mmetsp:Transcript_36304/g.56722  ORF Transcript_36304/g.56722 Transcript_36304/m.56722 type:complete len:125 (-) Transcript_36304:81-455(-)
MSRESMLTNSGKSRTCHATKFSVPLSKDQQQNERLYSVRMTGLIVNELLQFMQRKVGIEGPKKLLQVNSIDSPIPITIKQGKGRMQLLELTSAEPVHHRQPESRSGPLSALQRLGPHPLTPSLS